MFSVGDRVVYGSHGVCTVAAQERQLVNRKPVIYLVLEPLGQRGSRYLVPTHNAAAMEKLRPMLSAGELTALLAAEDIRKDAWICDEGQRKLRYRELLSGGDRERLLQMICTLYRYRRAQTEAGKRCHMCDENFLRDAEKLLCSEISVVMQMLPEEAKLYLRQQLNRE